MATLILPPVPLPPQYRGLAEIFEFTNWDGRHTRFNCGQAAACTFLTHHGILAADAAVMAAVECEHPPDNLGGWLGTSRRRVERICHEHGLELTEVAGEAELRCCLDARQPVIVMLQVPGPRLWGWTMPMGHWMVAYGFDREHIYLTNFGRMSWDTFRAAWTSFVPRLIRMRGRGLALLSRQGDKESRRLGEGL